MKRRCSLLLIVLVSLSCCKRNSSPPPSLFTKDSYPLAVGNWWEYQLTSPGYSTDTFILKVSSMVNASPYMQYNCDFTGNGTSAPAGYFLLSDTSLSFINVSAQPDYTPFQNFHLKFPVSKGQYWQGRYPPKDTILVLGVENTYSSYGHTYSPCYSTNESYILPHNFLVKSMLLTPKIGLIYGSIDFNSDTADRTQSYPGGVQINQSITLLNYHVQ